MPTLHELESAVLRAILDGDASQGAALLRGDETAAARRLALHANNARTNFMDSLRASFPAVRRLVGDDYFDQCADAFRARHPSRRGDLQFTGSDFAPFMAQRHAGSGHFYLGDVARFEWLYQEALIAADHAPLDPRRLAALTPQQTPNLRFRLHPAARLFASLFPVLDIWNANVAHAAEPPLIDLGAGADRVLIARTGGRVGFQRLSAGEHRFLDAIARHEPFAGAIEAAAGAALAADEAPCDAATALRRFVPAAIIVDFEPIDSEPVDSEPVDFDRSDCDPN